MRLRGEDELLDDDAPLPDPAERLTAADAFPPDGLETDGGEQAEDLLPSIPGPLIAAVTFVPTFLAVFFGLSYVVGLTAVGPTTPARTAEPPSRSAAAPLRPDVGEGLSETIRDPFVPPRLQEQFPIDRRDPREPSRTSNALESRESKAEEAPTPAPDVGIAPAQAPPAASAPAPALPPRAATQPPPEPRAPRAVEVPRKARPVPPT
ncbi:MAG TPA: hypothetical protein VLK35_03980, partial [Methylomirabilota bacterium]|nr:hypothetical protein [Methylomirabilota bacterium]